MGSGPTFYLGSNFKPKALLLMASYTSIQGIVAKIVGKVISKLVQERFNNLERANNVDCPVLFIHGEKDTLIPCT